MTGSFKDWLIESSIFLPPWTFATVGFYERFTLDANGNIRMILKGKPCLYHPEKGIWKSYLTKERIDTPDYWQPFPGVLNKDISLSLYKAYWERMAREDHP